MVVAHSVVAGSETKQNLEFPSRKCEALCFFVMSFIVAERCSKADVEDLVTAWTPLAQHAGHIST